MNLSLSGWGGPRPFALPSATSPAGSLGYTQRPGSVPVPAVTALEAATLGELMASSCPFPPLPFKSHRRSRVILVNENQDVYRKGRLIQHRAILACNVPVSSPTQPDCLQRGWEGFKLPCGCSMEVKAQECRIEVGGAVGKITPLTPTPGCSSGSAGTAAQTVISTSGSVPAEALEGGGGVICSPGALEACYSCPAPPPSPASGAGRAPVLNH